MGLLIVLQSETRHLWNGCGRCYCLHESQYICGTPAERELLLVWLGMLIFLSWINNRGFSVAQCPTIHVTPSAILGPAFGIVVSQWVLCATSHSRVFSLTINEEEKKVRRKEDTKLLLSSQMTGYRFCSAWQTTDTRGKVKMLQGCMNVWRYFSHS